MEYYEHFKRLMINSSDSNVDFVDGFTFEWGFRYELKIRETKLEEDLSDGTRCTYELLEVINKTPAPESSTFKLLLEGNRYYHQITPKELEEAKTIDEAEDNIFLYFDEVQIIVPPECMNAFQKIASGQSSKQGEFVHAGSNRIRLIKFL